jgi:hypothetical protein
MDISRKQELYTWKTSSMHALRIRFLGKKHRSKIIESSAIVKIK